MKFTFTKRLLLMVLLPLIIVSFILGANGVLSLQRATDKEVKNTLHAATIGLMQSLNAVAEGDYTYNNSKYYKGEIELSTKQFLLDDLKKDLGADVTVFYGDTRVLTTVSGAVGTKASGEVNKTVLQNGQEFFDTNVNVNNTSYYGYYIPIKSSSGGIIGMIFAGKPTSEVNKNAKTEGNRMILITIIVLLFSIVVSGYTGNKIAKALKKSRVAVRQMSEGNLRVDFDDKGLKRSDEIGSVYRRAKRLKDSMTNIIGKIQEVSNELSSSSSSLNKASDVTKTSSNNIASAIEVVSESAASQADHMQKANESVMQMGDMIENVVEDVTTLLEMADSMMQSKDAVMSHMNKLNDSNQKSYDIIRSIAKQVELTNESVLNIRNTVSLIQDIADQTNLLSLNASIEAARAGEAGKGFAVVAGEIKALAEQSNKSTISIQSTIEDLLQKSQATVEIMENVKHTISEQKEEFFDTEKHVEILDKGINQTMKGITNIKDISGRVNTEREEVISVIQSLSSISEENAANSEETMASIEELNATMEELSSRANSLEEIAKVLKNEISHFTV